MATATPKKKVCETIINACRCCNVDTNTQEIRVDLFGKKSLNEGLVNAIEQLASIKISKEDKLSRYICRTCARKIPVLYKNVTEFKKICTETAKKQLEKANDVREKRGRKDDSLEVEHSPLPQSAPKRALMENPVRQSLEERFRTIAPKPQLQAPTTSLPPEHVTSSHDAHLPHSEEVAVLSESGLFGIKVYFLQLYNLLC